MSTEEQIVEQARRIREVINAVITAYEEMEPIDSSARNKLTSGQLAGDVAALAIMLVQRAHEKPMTVVTAWELRRNEAPPDEVVALAKAFNDIKDNRTKTNIEYQLQSMGYRLQWNIKTKQHDVVIL